jgi:hypothetical protein
MGCIMSMDRGVVQQYCNGSDDTVNDMLHNAMQQAV